MVSRFEHVSAAWRGADDPVVVGPDAYPLYADDPFREAHDAITAAFEGIIASGFNAKLTQQSDVKKILNEDSVPRVDVVKAAVVRCLWVGRSQTPSASLSGYVWGCKLLGALLRRHLPFTAKDLVQTLDMLYLDFGCYPGNLLRTILQRVEVYVKEDGMPLALATSLRRLRKSGAVHPSSAQVKRNRAYIDDLLRRPEPDSLAFVEQSGELWADTLVNDLSAMETKERFGWTQLLLHCKAARGSRATNKWKTEAKLRLEAVDTESFTAHLIQWFSQVGMVAERAESYAEFRNIDPNVVEYVRQHVAKRESIASCDFPHASANLFDLSLRAAVGDVSGSELARFQIDHYGRVLKPGEIVPEQNATLLKGLVWCCAIVRDDTLREPLQMLAEVCFEKVSDVGASSGLVGHACIETLGSMGAGEQLTQLQSTVQYARARRRIETLLSDAERE